MKQFAKDQVQDIYYLSPMQEGMLFHTLLHPGQSFYIEQISMQLKGFFRTDWLEQSLNVLVDRYDIFRTVVLHEKMKRPVQVVLKQRNLQIREINLSGLPAEQQEEQIRKYKQQDKEQGFDLSKDIPMRTTVFKIGEGIYEWIWSYHHIVLDGWCFGIVIEELFEVYDAFQQNNSYSLQPVKPYKEYIKWLENQDKEKSFNYWRHYLSGFEGQPTFAEQRKKRRQEGYDPEEVLFQLTQEQTRTFSKLAGAHGVTVSTALQAVWAVLLSRYLRVNDLIFGTVVSGRPAEIDGVERMVGLFINVVPKRVQLNQDNSFTQLMIEVQRQSLLSEDHQYLPIYDIQSQAKIPDMIDHIIVFENYPLQKANDQQDEHSLGFTIENTDVFEKSNFDLNLIASPGSELVVKIAYNSTVYDSAFILRLKEQMLEIIRQISQNPHLLLKDIRVVSEQEQHLLLSEFNSTDADEPDPLTLAQWFERYAELTPDQDAVLAGEQTLTYTELNARANQLARALRSKGVTRGTIVALLVHRSTEMIIGILAILKVGGAYVPIDPDYPDQRISYILEDSGASLLLTQQALAGQVDAALYEGSHLFIEDPALYYGDAENLESAVDSNDLAYVMYTSGTTGNPKGTLTTHANITRVVKNTNYLEITGSDKLLSLSNYAFDGFTFDLFGALLNGAKLIIASKDTVLHIGELMRLIEEERITVMFVTTALFNLLVDAGSEWMTGLRKLLFGGERSSVTHVRKALQNMGTDKIIHVYGPTETTVFATFHPVNQILEDAITIPIGKPLNLTGAYILGPTNQLQPIEAVGELCLSGKGLARGYLNRTDLTGEKFVSHPFLPGQKLYRSGDLARWLPDGTIELVGRIDDQVKIRGHRIELGEIEAQLLVYSSAKEAVVLALSSDSGETSLCAYVVGQAGMELTSEELYSHLVNALPGYMVPQHYVLLDKLPLNANGKVNRLLLPKPEERINEYRQITRPTNDVEIKLADMWSAALGVKQISIHDNFFALGGHSLKAMALCAQMLKEFEIDVPVPQFFESPTIAGIAEYLQSAGNQSDDRLSKRVHPEMTVLNRGANRNLFVFPPVLGYGIMFNDLAKQLTEYCIHAFDFMEEADRISHYAKVIIDLQPEGYLTLLGYSAGCGLAFEVAKTLETLGRSVNTLIMVDSYHKTGISDLEGRSVEQDVEVLMSANQDNPYLQIKSINDGIVRKMSAYYNYHVDLINTGQVCAQIHMIKSENMVSLPHWMSPWAAATTSSYLEHQGYGKHDEMLQGGIVRLNGELIGRILKEIESKQQHS